MHRAAEAERNLPGLIRSHIEKEMTRLEQLRLFADELESLHKTNPPPTLSYLESSVIEPIDVYKYVKSGYNLTQRIGQLIEPSKTEEFNTAINHLPNTKDYNGVISALIRLDDIYPNSTDVLTGANPPFTTTEMYRLVDYLVNVFDKKSALKLAEKVLELYEIEENDSGVWTMIDYIAYLHNLNGDTEWAVHKSYDVLDYWESVGDNVSVQRVKNNIDNYLDELDVEERDYDPDDLPELSAGGYSDAYITLCNGQQLPGVTSNKPLHCYYSTQNNHPLLILSPAKIELINEELPLVYIHNFLTDKEIRYLMTTATSRFEESEVVSEEQTVVETQTRSSLTAWLEDHTDKIIENISGRISAITNLAVGSAEFLQVLSYGIGGYYEPHFDYAVDEQMNAFKNFGGNRIATWIFYLNDVKKGGGTVFPELGVTVWPEAGGAAFWMNLYKNGTGNSNTLHAACPVLEGYKWVANKWFHENENEFRHPCGLEEDL